MYRISVPVVDAMITEQTREDFLRVLRDAHAERVLLLPRGSHEDEDDLRARCAHLRESAAFFRANGIEPAIWVSNTIGHGAPLAGVKIAPPDARYAPLVNLAGDVLPGTCCPFDADFRRMTARYIAGLARYSGIGLIFLDDDYRLSQHGREFCCACERHMARICELCGETVSRAQLKALAFEQKPNKYRDAWLCAQRESLELLARDIRAAVDEVDPAVCVALCAAHSIWGVDGSAATDIARLLAGNNRPVVRLHPAPYWAVHSSMPLPVVFEIARMFAHLGQGSGCELMAEGDTYPRPRYNTPSSYLELFDAVMRADGQHDGMLKYMIDYCSPLGYETGYLRRHMRDLPRMEAITAMFDGKQTCGVSVPVDASVMSHADFSVSDAYTNNHPLPAAGRMLAQLSIPTTFSDDGMCTALFGESARSYPLERLSQGAVLDGTAARILTERGVDVGLCEEGSFVTDVATTVRAHGAEHIVCIKRQTARLWVGALDARCEIALRACLTAAGEVPLCYRYVNAAGQRFAVCTADTTGMSHLAALLKGYFMQHFMLDAIAWIAARPLPAVCRDEPDLYLLCKRSADGGRLAVGLFNCSADSILEPVIRLDGDYHSLRTVGCHGTLCGDTVHLDAPIPAFEFAAFEVAR